MKTIRRYNLSYLFVVMLGILISIQMGMFLGHQFWGFEINWNLFQYCVSVLEEASIGHGFVKIVLYALILYSAARITYRSLKQSYLSLQLNRRIKHLTNVQLTKIMNDRFKHWNMKIIVLATLEPTAMSAGLIRPRIIVSKGLLEQLSKEELKAVLLHELHHCKQKDPLKSFVISIFKDGFGFIPIISSAAYFCKTWMELMADRFAINQMGTEQHLGSALLLLSKTRSKRAQIDHGVVYFENSAIDYRMLQILDPNKTLKVPFIQSVTILQSLIIMFVMFVLVLGGCA
jgi:Zn-dependent protease with chaperone function